MTVVSLASDEKIVAPTENLSGLSLHDIQSKLATYIDSNYRTKQIYHALYKMGVTDLQQIHNIPKNLRHSLLQNFRYELPSLVKESTAKCGTRKSLLRLDDGNMIEVVFIPSQNKNQKYRGSLCISSQVGCTLNCPFCRTGSQRLIRNLKSHEIVNQILSMKNLLNDWNNQQRLLTNIIVMGMGEPLLNTDAVIEALTVAMDQQGLDFSKRRITLSTSGIVPQISRIGQSLGVRLAISLHAPNDTLRNTLVPINRKYPLSSLLDAVRSYPTLSNMNRVTWEYVMLHNVNDSDDHAIQVSQLIKDIPSKINLIPFNPWPSSSYTCSTPERISQFASILRKAGYPVLIRQTRGQDILAACGQLLTEPNKKQ